MTRCNGWQAALFVFLGLQTLAISARCYVKLKVLKGIRPEDITIVIAYILSMAYGVCNTVLYFHSDGNEKAEKMSHHQLETSIWLAYSAQVIYPIAALTCKTAIGLLLARLFKHMWLRVVSWIALIAYGVLSIAYFFFLIFMCGNPASELRMLTVPGACPGWSALGPMTYMYASAGILVDIIYISLPLFYIRTANMDLRTKVSVAGILALGSIGIICSIIRIPFINDILHRRGNYYRLAQGFRAISSIEIALWIIGFSLQSCKPLFQKMFTTLRSTCRSRSAPQTHQDHHSSSTPMADIEKLTESKEVSVTIAGDKSTPSPSSVYASSSTYDLPVQTPVEMMSAAEEARVLSEGLDFVMIPPAPTVNAQNEQPEQSDKVSEMIETPVTAIDNMDEYGYGRRRSRIKSIDWRFYGGLKLQKPTQSVSSSPGLMPVSSGDMHFYGIQDSRLPDASMSPLSDVAESPEKDTSTMTFSPTTIRPILEALDTSVAPTKLAVPMSADTLSPGASRRSPVSPKGPSAPSSFAVPTSATSIYSTGSPSGLPEADATKTTT